MPNSKILTLLALNLIFTPQILRAADSEILVNDKQNTDLSLSIYNNNLAFVKDTREVTLEAGKSRVAFEGVASQIKPETAMMLGNAIKVIEQNYDYNLLTPMNILNESIGDTVKTAVTNPENGQDIFSQAQIVNSNYGAPILKFDYGIETNFPGRIIYEKLPANLRTKPTLVVDLDNSEAGSKKLELAYLTNGMNWKTDYIAEISSPSRFTLNGWVTLTNESGTDYKNAQVQLIAGSINQVQPAPIMPAYRNMMAAKAFDSAAMGMAESAPAREALSDYYLYTLPFKTTIKDKQSKQVSLMTKQDVKYTKEYKFVSPFYLGINTRANEFEKQNPEVLFKLVNNQESNLGEPLPSGTIRMYQKDNSGNLQFIGESSISHSAVGEKIELNTGKAFDIYTKGKIAAIQPIAKNIREMEVELTFDNAKDEKADMVFEQNFNDNFEILSESLPGENKNSQTRQWKFEIAPKSATILTFKVRVSAQQ